MFIPIMHSIYLLNMLGKDKAKKIFINQQYTINILFCPGNIFFVKNH
jgi:hypothetical protein